MIDTMALLFERLKIVVEPSGATALAAVLTNPERFAGRRVGVILSAATSGSSGSSSYLPAHQADRKVTGRRCCRS